MKRYGLWLAALWTVFTAAAQSTLEAQTSITTEHKRIEILVNGARVRLYSATQYDSLIVVPDYGLKVYVKDRPSQDFLDATYREVTEEENISSDENNKNKNVDFTDSRRYAWRLEYPKTRNDENNIISVHELPAPEGVTLSIEWDCEKRAQRWTCYQFHDGFKDNKVDRARKWNDDPNIPEQYRTHSKDYDGMGHIYHRGHMCNSLDRRNSEAQNEQTFFISNAHPQFAAHNTGIWKSLEARVNKWGMDSNFRDTLYVVKAGTIDEDRVLAPMKSPKPGRQEVLVPKFMYMAILCKKGNDYKAIGFWTEHEENPPRGESLQSFAKSIRELERLTGIDFFCNLPDDIENQVEEHYDLKDWEW